MEKGRFTELKYIYWISKSLNRIRKQETPKSVSFFLGHTVYHIVN